MDASYELFVNFLCGRCADCRKLGGVKLLILLILAATLQAQPVLRQAIPVKADSYLGMDKFGAHYTIRENVFAKIDGTLITEFQDVRLGKITRADIRNPLLIVLFYENFNTIVLLDNQLAEVTRVDFNQRPEPMIIRAAGLASRNMIWLYDQVQQQMLLFDYQANVFKRLGAPLPLPPVTWHSDLNYFLWTNASGETFSMDIFGKVSAVMVPTGDEIRYLGGDQWLIRRGRNLFFLDEKGIETKLLNDRDSLKNFYFNDQNLSIFTGREVEIYNIKLP